jgi:hypothetical protein
LGGRTPLEFSGFWEKFRKKSFFGNFFGVLRVETLAGIVTAVRMNKN